MHRYSSDHLASVIDAAVQGDSVDITGIAPIQLAEPGQVTFLDNPAYRRHLATTKASAVILSPQHAVDCPVTALVVANPYYGYACISQLFVDEPSPTPGIHPTAIVADSAQIQEGVSIGPYCVIEEAAVIGAHTHLSSGVCVGRQSQIGAHVRLFDRVAIYPRTEIHNHVTIHVGAVLGSDGFGMAKHQGKWHKIAQLGRLVVGEGTEVGANTTIDRGALGDTVIGCDVHLDNQIQIGHNVVIGDRTAIAGCTAVAGSVTIGSDCLIGGGVCIAGHLSIVDNVAINGMSGITKSITKPGHYSSSLSAQESHVWRKNLARLRRLDRLMDRSNHSNI